MRQVLQDLKSGQTQLVAVTAPPSTPGMLVVRTRSSLISAGTERMLAEFGRANLLQKARAQPERVKQVLEKIRTDGLLQTATAVWNRLGEPLPLGYCNAGVVLEVGRGVEGWKPGDRVASNGPHAEIVAVPRNLCAHVPDGLPDEAAAFTPMASIALQGIRLLQPTLGERVVVYGLGLIGLMAVQLLRAHGCQVLGVDVNPERMKLAEGFGARVAAGQDGAALAAASAWCGGQGVDGVLITASSKSDSIVHESAQMCRRRGRIVLVGQVDLNLQRADFYEKELSFQVSCSYGPGRYDDRYEVVGQDYPLGFVRWTEQRNFEAVLAAMATGQLKTKELISHRFPLDQAPEAYRILLEEPTALGIVLEYPETVERESAIVIGPQSASRGSAGVRVGVVGAGNFAKMTLLPALVKTRAELRWIADIQGAAAASLARKHGARMATSDHRQGLKDADTDAVFLAVGHHLHAHMVAEALAAGKHVFVEKPLAIDLEGLRAVLSAVAAAPGRQLMVGFNRRFSPHVEKMKSLLRGRGEPLAMSMMVNAGAIPSGHWVHDPERGGGRIIGEGCHFIDLLVHLAGSKVKTVVAAMVSKGTAVRDDKMSILLTFEDGSVGAVHYFANGSKSYPKESLEVFSDGRVLRLDNFRKLEGFGFRGFSSKRTMAQDKGHAAEFKAFVEKVARGGEWLIPLDELVNVTLASFAAMTAAREGRVVVLDREYGEALVPAGR